MGTTLTRPRLARLVLLGVAAAMAAACGGAKDSGFTTVGGGASAEAGGGGSAEDDGSSMGPDDSGSGAVFTSAEAASVAFDCQPGTYTGMYKTTVTSDAGGLFSLFTYGWGGNLSITLEGMVTNTGAGEIPLPTLTIAPGAKLAGVDQMGVMFEADLSGQLDCPSKKLTVAITNGLYGGIGDAGGIPMSGTMTATYDGTTTPPTLSMGSMDIGSPSLMGLDAIGNWTASLR
jgi:hypothetical protein